jgi:NADPH-dependent curcumin reductase CurA
LICRYGIKNFFAITQRQLRVEGFLVGRMADRFPTAVADMSKWLKSGELKSEETVVEGFETLPSALLSLFKGENVGKLVVKV